MGRATTLYARVYTSIQNHRKFIALDPAAIGLWLMGLIYCWDQFTDGVIPKAAVPRLIAVKPERAHALAALLVKAVLWEVDGETFRVHDWAEHNPTADDFLTKRQTERDRKERWKRRGRNAGRDAGTTRQETRKERGRNDVSGSGSYTPLNPPHDSDLGKRETSANPRARGTNPRSREEPRRVVLSPEGFEVAGLCAQPDRQAGRQAGECARSFNCPRYKICAMEP